MQTSCGVSNGECANMQHAALMGMWHVRSTIQLQVHMGICTCACEDYAVPKKVDVGTQWKSFAFSRKVGILEGQICVAMPLSGTG